MNYLKQADKVLLLSSVFFARMPSY